MKKVIFSITKLGRVENTKVTGVGYITDEDRLLQTSANPVNLTLGFILA